MSYGLLRGDVFKLCREDIKAFVQLLLQGNCFFRKCGGYSLQGKSFSLTWYFFFSFQFLSHPILSSNKIKMSLSPVFNDSPFQVLRQYPVQVAAPLFAEPQGSPIKPSMCFDTGTEVARWTPVPTALWSRESRRGELETGLRISGEKWPRRHPSFSPAPLYSPFLLIWGKNGKIPKAALPEDTQAGGSSCGRKGRIPLNLCVALAPPTLRLTPRRKKSASAEKTRCLLCGWLLGNSGKMFPSGRLQNGASWYRNEGRFLKVGGELSSASICLF